jgi:hypothetical protein
MTFFDASTSIGTGSLSSGTATSVQKGEVVTLTACDPGPTAANPPNSAAGALVVAELRNELLRQVVGGGIPVATGDCIATRLVRDPVLKPVIAQATADPNGQLSDTDKKALQQKVTDLTVACLKR